VEYNLDGTMYAIGAGDNTIKVFDETTKTLSTLLSPGYGEEMGHFNRVSSLKFIDANLIASGGWDKNVFVWDLRS
jgi:WD40 repeat protein